MDFWQIVLVAISAFVGAWAQFKLKSTFSKYAKVPCSNGINGWKAAAQLLKIHNINDVKIGPIAGSLTNCTTLLGFILKRKKATKKK